MMERNANPSRDHEAWIAVALKRILVFSLLASAVGCGTTQSQLATQQLLMSDAVDRAIERFDFAPLQGEKVYLDTEYVQTLKTVGFVNSDYVVSAVRQQMFAAGCEMQDTKEQADYVVEIRVGALATDGHEVTYGIPPSKSISSAASVLPNVPDVPAMPEISLAKRQDQLGAAKVAVFAYDRITRTPVWQSGTSVAMSDSKNTWFFGAGPFQRGTIYKGTRFAGAKLENPLAKKTERKVEDEEVPHPDVQFAAQHTFPRPTLRQPAGVAIPASHTASRSEKASGGGQPTTGYANASGG